MSQYIPEGSFTLTSKNIRSTLYTKSQKRDGKYIPASLDLTNLSSADVANMDGFLVNQTHSGSASGYVPSGSYQKTSDDIVVVLSAECQKRDQTYQESTLVISGLNNVSVSNIDGVLTVDE
ncbi:MULTISPECIES: hypothetical protein [Pseudoalteromonas]|uniref:Uncharacterized protein n=1 Tax=Pseudoalteromonas obscura TaxID=3048491 RepID=A0ABT7EJ33_9GAMM|nr:MULTISPECIES: hypothetical protein [Pseudoalteromonas]MBQ4836596.1 hypothetical protein [Pseudoalteromonas luteoviolacea]MDK2595022.1 hypothetical protein [Pseudoalteromonas sp. P94(2023)]